MSIVVIQPREYNLYLNSVRLYNNKHKNQTNMKKIILAIVALIAISTSLVAPSVFAATCGMDGKGDDIQTSIDYGCTSKDENGILQILVAGINFMAIGVGIAVIFGIVLGSLKYASADGNASQAQKGIEIIVASIVSLLVFIFMWAIVNFLVPGGAFVNNLPKNTKPPQTTPVVITWPPFSRQHSPSTGGGGGSGSIATQACYNVKVTKADIATKDRFHRKSGQPYALENSIQGIDYAASHGYKAIDIDVMVTKDGVLVGSHAWEPLQSGITGGFKDPTGKLDKDTRLSEMTLAEVRRLRHKDGYRISTLEELIIHAKSRGINLILEMKVPSKIEKQLPKVAATLNKYGVKAGVTSRKDKAGYVHALEVARSLGFHTRMASSPGASAKDRTWVSPSKDANKCKSFGG